MYRAHGLLGKCHWVCVTGRGRHTPLTLPRLPLHTDHSEAHRTTEKLPRSRLSLLSLISDFAPHRRLILAAHDAELPGSVPALLLDFARGRGDEGDTLALETRTRTAEAHLHATLKMPSIRLIDDWC